MCAHAASRDERRVCAHPLGGMSAGMSAAVAFGRPHCLLLDDCQNVLLADDQQLFAVDLELGAGVLRVKDALALLDVDRLAAAVIEDPARADGEDLPLLRLFLGG